MSSKDPQSSTYKSEASRIPAYVINLPRAVDRLEHMRDMADLLKFHFHRIEATDGANLEFVNAIGRQPRGEITGLRMAAAEVACFMSHRRVWQRILSGEHRFGLVMEDDLIFQKDFANLLEKHWIPKDADITRLETRGTLCHLSRTCKASISGRKVRQLLSMHGGAAAYIVSRTAAGKLLKLTEKIVDPVDQVLFNDASSVCNELMIYQVSPSPVTQADRIPVNSTASWAVSSLQEERKKNNAVRSKFQKQTIYLPRLIRGKAKAVVKGTLYGSVPFK